MAEWIDIGKVKIRTRGEWDEEEQYEEYDVVTYHHYAYIARQDNKGIHPVDDETTEYWEQFGSAAQIATLLKTGLVKPDGITITIDEDGTIHGAGGDAKDITFNPEGTDIESRNVEDAIKEEYERITPKVPITNAEFEALKASGQLQRNTEYCITDLPYSADDVLSLEEIRIRGASGALKSTDVPNASAVYDLLKYKDTVYNGVTLSSGGFNTDFLSIKLGLSNKTILGVFVISTTTNMATPLYYQDGIIFYGIPNLFCGNITVRVVYS